MLNVRVIQDDALPVWQDWALVDDRGRVTLFVKRSAMGSGVMADAHAGFWKLRGRPPRAVMWDQPALAAISPHPELAAAH